MRRALFIACLLACLALPVAAGAAAPSPKKGIWGPAEVDGVSQFPIYEDLGVGVLQQTLRWWDVARKRPAHPKDPDDPAYAWPADIDAAVAGARGTGIQISIAVLGAPGWANGGHGFNYAPRNPRPFADFLEAASKRWPSVRDWMIWIEPTKAQNFQPLARRGDRPFRTARQKEGPRRYAALLDAAYGRLHKVRPGVRVIGGNTFTVGDVTPHRWIEDLRLRNGRRPRMDLWGHNPFSLRNPVLSEPPLGYGYADFGDLDTLMGWLDRAGYRDSHGRPLRLFLSEYSLPTNANHEFNFYVSERRQATWIAQALRTARRTARIATLGYLGLYDDPPRPGGDEVRRGLITLAGRHRPAYAAYRDG